MLSDWEVEGFVFEAKRRNKVTEECSVISWCYELSASKYAWKAGLRIEASQTNHPHSTKAGHHSHWPALFPCRGPCWGMN